MTASARPRALFVAGANGATGRSLMARSETLDLDIVPHYRPTTAARLDSLPRSSAVLDLTDAASLQQALEGRTTVVQLIGTMRKRFQAGDTYQSSDIGTTEALLKAAEPAGVDHVVLLSSVGAGRPLGAYLRAKAAAEDLVRSCGIDWTIVRPSAFIGGGHRPPPGTETLTRLLGLDRYRPIPIEELARLLLHLASTGSCRQQILEGATLWRELAACPPDLKQVP